MTKRPFVDQAAAQRYVARMSMGARIKKARRAKGLTQAQLGAEVGVTSQAVSGWERGESEPVRENLAAIAKATGADLYWLLDENQQGEALAEPAPAETLSSRASQYLPPGEALAFARWCADYLETHSDVEGSQEFLAILIQVLKQKGDDAAAFDIERFRLKVETLLDLSRAGLLPSNRRKS